MPDKEKKYIKNSTQSPHIIENYIEIYKKKN